MATGLENLWIYKLAEDMEIQVHEITKKFPVDEKFRSIDQLRRSSASVSNNIAESYHKRTSKEKDRYLSIAKGEAEETKRNIIKSARKKFISEQEADKIAEQYTVILKGISAYIRFLVINDEGKPKPKTI
ncbi:MAG: four helix bundle protein [Bacteroidetes bacterium]|nr:four helix bundle protein [Bacteroidota bacterium]